MQTASTKKIPTIDTDSPLKKAYRLQEFASRSGLDWPEAGQIWSSINDELAEVKSVIDDPSVLAKRLALRAHKMNTHCIDGQNFEHCLQESLGKLLFAVVYICRSLDIDPDLAIDAINESFAHSCEYVRLKAAEQGLLMGLIDRETIGQLWKEAANARSINDKTSAFPLGPIGTPAAHRAREATHGAELSSIG